MINMCWSSHSSVWWCLNNETINKRESVLQMCFIFLCTTLRYWWWAIWVCGGCNRQWRAHTLAFTWCTGVAVATGPVAHPTSSSPVHCECFDNGASIDKVCSLLTSRHWSCQSSLVQHPWFGCWCCSIFWSPAKFVVHVIDIGGCQVPPVAEESQLYNRYERVFKYLHTCRNYMVRQFFRFHWLTFSCSSKSNGW